MAIADDWWETFFKGPFGDLQLQGGNQSIERDVQRIANLLGAAPKRILDAPCGVGRHAVALAALGHEVVGVDFNTAVLEKAERGAAERGLSIELELQDLRTLALHEQFDAVLCLWTSIGYFSDEDNEALLSKLARAVKPGGYLILDSAVMESLCAKFSPRAWSWWGEGDERVRVCEERTWDCETARLNVTWTFSRQGHEETRRSSIRTYSCRELVGILQRCGLANFNCLGRDGEPFAIGAPRLWLEAQKTA